MPPPTGAAGRAIHDLWKSTLDKLCKYGLPTYLGIALISPGRTRGSLEASGRHRGAGTLSRHLRFLLLDQFADGPNLPIVGAWRYLLLWHTGRMVTTLLVIVWAQVTAQPLTNFSRVWWRKWPRCTSSTYSQIDISLAKCRQPLHRRSACRILTSKRNCCVLAYNLATPCSPVLPCKGWACGAEGRIPADTAGVDWAGRHPRQPRLHAVRFTLAAG